MATELIERLVIAEFDSNDLTYAVERDDVVRINLPTSHGVFRVTIIDHEAIVPLIAIAVPYFVRFPGDRRGEAMELLNEINRKIPGVFSIDEDGDVSYSYDWLTGENATPEDFKTALTVALSTYAKSYPEIMAARWSDKPTPAPEEARQ